MQSPSALVILLALTSVASGSDFDSGCQICKDIATQFTVGLDKTMNSNFGGGNTKWEEKSLGKWKTSETRLVEIIEHHLCQGEDKKRCHMFFENNEESLERWYFDIYKDADSADGLHDYWCVQETKVCCPAGKYGKSCDNCPLVRGKVCGGHGKCEGDGTRDGTGACKCDPSYQGELCEDCKDRHYMDGDKSNPICIACDLSCEDECSSAGPLGCDGDCADGYSWDSSTGCQDVNECAEKDKCHEGKFCSNTKGSYDCQSCHHLCKSCSGGADLMDCLDCIDGYKLTTLENQMLDCQDIDECQEEDVCTSVQGSVCSNTIGSYSCQCPEGQMEENAVCIDKPPEPVTTPATPTSTEPSLEMPKPPTEGKGSKKTSASKKKKKQKEKPEPQSQKMEIDLDPENKNKKRVYRALDTMVLCSATGLFLVLILVLNNEFFKSSALTIVYAVFVYIWSGQW